MGTREKILEKALAIANADGLERLTIRVVADALELSPGNVTYHFRRKADLVLGLAAELSKGNEEIWRAEAPVTLEAYLERLRRLFQRQWKHRALLLSLAHALEAYPEIRKRYRLTERQRKDQNRALIYALRDAGQLAATDEQVERFLMHLTLTSRFWIGEFRVTYYRHPVAEVIDHYLALIADLLAPHATTTGRQSIAPYLSGFIESPAE